MLRIAAALGAVGLGIILRERPLGATISFIGLAFLALWFLFLIGPDLVPVLFGLFRTTDDEEPDRSDDLL